MEKVWETDRLTIKTIETSSPQLKELLRIYNKSNNMKYISGGKSKWTHDELLQKINKCNSDNNGYGIYFVELKSTGKIIGEAGIFESFDEEDKIEIGYIIDCLYWRHGYGKELCKSLLYYCFDHLITDKVVARIYKENVASIKVAESVGMNLFSSGVAENGREFVVYEVEK